MLKPWPFSKYTLHEEVCNSVCLQHDSLQFGRYVMLKGVNDSLEDAERLWHTLKPIHCAVNLIMYNSHKGAPFKASEPSTVLAFRDAVRAHGKLCTIRESKVCWCHPTLLRHEQAIVIGSISHLLQGDDEMAACGQLGSEDRQRIAPKEHPSLYSP